MKLTRIDAPITGKTKIVWEVEEHEVVTSVPTKMEQEMLRVAKHTNKISNYLMYFSELAKNIEDNRTK